MSGDAPGDEAGGGGTSRRNLVRLLIALGFGIPILVEGITFLGLMGDLFGNGEDTPTPSASPTATASPTPEPVEEGDELLPGTPPTDRLVSGTVEDTADGRELTLVVEVENDATASYQLRLSRVVTAAGDQVEGGGATDTLGPGESATLTARWTLPADADPAAVEVVAILQDEEGNSDVVRRVVPLADSVG